MNSAGPLFRGYNFCDSAAVSSFRLHILYVSGHVFEFLEGGPKSQNRALVVRHFKILNLPIFDRHFQTESEMLIHFKSECSEFIAYKSEKNSVKTWNVQSKIGMSSLLVRLAAIRGFRRSKIHSDRSIFELQCLLGRSLSCPLRWSCTDQLAGPCRRFHRWRHRN